MKKLIISIFMLLITFAATAQTQADIDKAMQQLQDVMKNLPPEAKKLIDSMGVNEKLTKNTNDLKAKGITDKQIKKAVEDANRLVPKRNDALILLANKRLNNETELKTFLVTKCDLIQKKLGTAVLNDIETVVKSLKQKPNGNSVTYAGTALMLMINNKPTLALAAFTKEFQKNPSADKTDLNNFSALCNLMGGEEVSLPILYYLNKENPYNTTFLNNIGQAWFTLGERDSAELYIKRALKVEDYNPEANETMSLIYKDKGMNKEAEDALKKSFKAEFSTHKEELAKKFGIKLTKDDYNLPPKLKNDPLGFLNIRRPDFQFDIMDYARHTSIDIAWRDAVESELSKLNTEYEKLDKELHHDDPDWVKANFTSKISMATNKSEKLQVIGRGTNFLQITSFLINNPDQTPEALLLKTTLNHAKIQSDLDQTIADFEDYQSKIKYDENDNCIYKKSDEWIRKMNPEISSKCEKDIKEFVSYYTDALYYYMHLNSDLEFEQIKIFLKMEFLKMLISDAKKGGSEEPKKNCYKNFPPGNVKLAKWEDTHCPVYANFSDPTGSFSIHWDCHGSETKIDCPVYKETETYKYDDANQLTIKGSYWMGFEAGKTLGGKGAENLPVKLGLTGSLGYYQETNGGTLMDGFAQLYDVKDRPNGNVITNEGVQAGVEAKSELNLTNKKYFGQEGHIVDKITSNPFEQETTTGTKTSIINPNPIKQDVGGVKPEVSVSVIGKLSFNNGPNTITPASSVFGWNGSNFYGDGNK